MRTEDTAGNVIYTIPNCDCGSTSGCEKCQPIRISRYGYEERFLDEKLKEFYRKKGLLYSYES